jgi:hypothetical protein
MQVFLVIVVKHLYKWRVCITVRLDVCACLFVSVESLAPFDLMHGVVLFCLFSPSCEQAIGFILSTHLSLVPLVSPTPRCTCDRVLFLWMSKGEGVPVNYT